MKGLAEELGTEGIYGRLWTAFGPRGWWPLPSRAGETGYNDSGYHPGVYPGVTPGNALGPEDRLEIALGALLTQNTNWRNASRAVKSLLEAAEGRITPDFLGSLGSLAEGALEKLIRPSGYYNQKAERLRRYVRFIQEAGWPREPVPRREDLLSLRGIGGETADSILLYAYGQPFFVIDAYTRRIFSRLALPGTPQEKAGYDIWQGFFPSGPTERFQEYHALLVQLGKDYCRKKPLCAGCPLTGECLFFQPSE